MSKCIRFVDQIWVDYIVLCWLSSFGSWYFWKSSDLSITCIYLGHMGLLSLGAFVVGGFCHPTIGGGKIYSTELSHFSSFLRTSDINMIKSWQFLPKSHYFSCHRNKNITLAVSFIHGVSVHKKLNNLQVKGRGP